MIASGLDRPVVAITAGDCNGVGPEVALKTVLMPAVQRHCRPVLVGPEEVFGYYLSLFKMKLRLVPFSGDASPPTKRGRLSVPYVHSSSIRPSMIAPGRMSATAGRAAARSIEKAVDLAISGEAGAVVTAPVSKEALHRAGTRFPGQTEMLQRLTASPVVAMMLVSDTMRVGLITIHVPVRRVAQTITTQLIVRRVQVMYSALQNDWRIPEPRIAVLGLNPHAGEGGHIGREEHDLIIPALEHLRHGDMQVDGPFPADAFFGNNRQEQYDAVIAMYHDQGLIPLKMSSFGRGVNVTAGLPIVRTSPDHGTAFDIAGKGIANPGSMKEAVLLAAILARNRAMSTTMPTALQRRGMR